MPKCKRCGREYENPIPKVRNADAPKPGASFVEIATDEWCANCNRVGMSAIYRNNSAYFDKDLPFGGLSSATQPEEGKDEFD